MTEKTFKNYFEVTFAPDDTYTVRLLDKPGEPSSLTGAIKAEGTYIIDHDLIVLKDKSKEGASEGDAACSDPGRYRWRFDGKALTFTKIEDDCEGRAAAVTSAPWVPADRQVK